jgi:phage-related protein
MFSLIAENVKGDKLSLTNNPNYTITRIEGLNPPPATLNMTANSTVDGSKVNSVKVESRNIVLYIKPENDIEKNRIKLYSFFSTSMEVTLHFKNHSRNVYISGVVETCELCQFDFPQMIQVSIICPDPYFNDVKEATMEFSNVIPSFEFPFSIPAEGVEFTRYLINNRKSIVNESDINTSIVIVLYASGKVTNPIIYDVTHDKHIKLNMEMQYKDTITIDTNMKKMSITMQRDGVTSNILGYMQPDSNWFVVTPGDNVYAYDCDEGVSSLHISFKIPVKYGGV